MTSDAKLLEGIDDYKYGFRSEDVHVFQSPRKGLDRGIVEQISAMKQEPQWMLDFRLKALAHFESRPMPEWGGDLSKLNLDEIYFYTKPTEKEGRTWDDVPESIKNTFDKLGIPEAEQKFLAGVGAQYECLSEDTRVYSHRGLVPIRDIEPGDVVYSLVEETRELVPSRVKAKAFKGDRKVFEVRVGARTIKATENHPFYVLDYQRAEDRKRGRYTPRWKYLRDIKQGDLVCVARAVPDTGISHRLVQPKVKTVVTGRNQAVEYALDISARYNSITLPDETSPDLMWWLGFYIGDGFIHYEKGADKARVEIAIPSTEIQLREEFIRITEQVFGSEVKTEDPYRLTIYSTILVRFLELNGFKGKAHDKCIPDWLSSLPQAELLAFIGGYVDADGYVRDSKKNKDIHLTSVNIGLLAKIKELASLCGLPSSNLSQFESRHPKDPNRMMVGYRLQIYGDFERLDCRSPRRVSRFGKRKFHHTYSSAAGTKFRSHTSEHMGFVRVDSIAPAGISPVYDIEVDGPHNFVAEGLIVHNSEMVYHSIKEHLAEQGVLFKSIEQGLKDHEELFREYFGTVIPIEDNKFAALNSAVWSGGSFVYVPPGVTVDMPLQAYFRINTPDMGQFERTLIILDEGAQVHYVEGCTAPIYSTDSFHSGVIEIVVKKGARMRYTTIQNWSTNMYNLVTQRALVFEDAKMEWVDANLGCLQEGSAVTTPSGQKAIEELAVGEEVLSYDPETGQLCFRPVVAKRFSGYQKVREIRAGERRLFATSNHPFLSYTYHPERPRKLGRYAMDYVRADQLKHAIIPRTSIDYGRPHRLELPEVATTFASRNQYQESYVATRVRARRLKVTHQTDEKLMWLFGLYLGDGHIRRQPGKSAASRYASVGFSVPVNSRARAKLEKVMSELLEAAPTERQDGIQVTWNSIELADLFEAHGFTGLAATKRIPDWVFSTPESQRLALLAGYIDSDGAIVQSKRRFSIKSVNREILEDTARLATSLGMNARLYTEFDTPRQVTIRGVASIAHGSHRLELALDGRLLPFLSEDMRNRVEDVPLSSSVYRRQIGRSNIRLPESVEVAPVSVGELSALEVPTWDIEVAGTGNFVSEGFIVHNSKLTMKYPSCYLLGERAHGEILSLAFAAHGQHQDTGGKVIHVAPNTSSVITSKSISKNGGRASYRGLLKVHPEAEGSSSNVVCDALLLDDHSRSDTYPYIEIDAQDVTIGHEASVSKVGEEQLFYLMSRGLTEEAAITMVVAGFIEPLVKELPMEYAVEMNRLIQLQMEGSIG